MFLPNTELTQRKGTKSSSPIFSPNTDSFVLVRKSINEINSLSDKGTKSSSPIFSPNTDSFVLVRKSINEINSLSDKGTKSSSPIFSPNTDSFVLVRKSINEINSLSDKGTKSSSPIFSPNTDSFVLVRKSINEINSLSGKGTKSSSPIFLPNTDSFVLVRKSINEINSLSGTENITDTTSSQSTDSEQPKVNDNGKRKFLKVAGFASAGVVASQLLPKKASAFIMGSSPTTGVVGVKDSTNTRINPATEETLDQVLKTTDLTFDAGAVEVKIAGVSGAGTSSFSDSGDVAKSALVDGDRHVQVDVLSSALPTTASTETTLQTISFGGFKFSLRLATVGDIDYIGEATIGTATSATSWRVKKVDSTTGIIILWAGTGVFDQVWDNYASLTYS
ncbi:MAG: hypothetical protein ACI8V7_000365 [Candidatus Paceibacteria bacterium]|jgi:hypothetical protein